MGWVFPWIFPSFSSFDSRRYILICSCQCQKCFFKCVLEKGHGSDHCCRGTHKCTQYCIYCEEEAAGDAEQRIYVCGDAAGHDGPHTCAFKSHTCGEECAFKLLSSSCNSSCYKKKGHDGDHRCNSRQHECRKDCSLPSCSNRCVVPIDGGDHEESDIHACHEKVCPEQCTMKGCNRTCAERDHFHGQKPGIINHFCGAQHPCQEECEHEGNCEVTTEVSKKTKFFKGKRATFDYELVSEQYGKRKSCCLMIPPFSDLHDGPHLHSEDPNSVHFCETRCPSCGYFCYREFGHGGLHRTVHGNMREKKFVAESEDIDILDRKYTWGESGVAELCNMHCKAQGRGHVHLLPCPRGIGNQPECLKIFDGCRHETCRYGPDVDVQKDELTHTAYWQYLRFEDPCSAEERREFDLCAHRCKSEEHDPPAGSATSAATIAQHASYCTERLWHDTVTRGDARFPTGYITDDGHHFNCDHTKNV